MRASVRQVLLACGLAGVLSACGQEAPSPSPDPSPYAGGRAYPWSYAPAPERVAAQRLTPTENTLQYETILGASSGWGPIELNRSNGEQGDHDGGPLTLNGTAYALGFGTHAHGEMRFDLEGYNDAACTRFTADVGVDDEVGDRGSVIFRVLVDGVEKYSSGTMTGSSATRHVEVDLSGGQELQLLVTDAGDGIDYDHADWVNPEVTCVREGQVIDYGFRFEPPTLCVPLGGGRVEVTLLVEDRGIAQTTLPSGPVSFRLVLRTEPGVIEVADPDTIYATRTFPARFQVAVNVPARFYGTNGIQVQLTPWLEDYGPAGFFANQHRTVLTLITCETPGN